MVLRIIHLRVGALKQGWKRAEFHVFLLAARQKKRDLSLIGVRGCLLGSLSSARKISPIARIVTYL